MTRKRLFLCCIFVLHFGMHYKQNCNNQTRPIDSRVWLKTGDWEWGLNSSLMFFFWCVFLLHLTLFWSWLFRWFSGGHHQMSWWTPAASRFPHLSICHCKENIWRNFVVRKQKNCFIPNSLQAFHRHPAECNNARTIKCAACSMQQDLPARTMLLLFTRVQQDAAILYIYCILLHWAWSGLIGF